MGNPASVPSARKPRAAKPQPVPVPKTRRKALAPAKPSQAAQEAAKPPRPVFRSVAATLTLSTTNVPPASEDRAAPGTSSQANGPASVPPAAKPRELTDLERRFCFEYVQDCNATRAYMRATRNTNDRSASVQATRLLANPNIRARVEEERRELQARAGVTTEDLIRRLLAIATADPRELSEHIIESCRWCHGEGHGYHRTAIEYERDRREWEVHGRQRIGGTYLSARKAKAREKVMGGPAEEFEEQGGPGFDPAQPPHPHCPQCHGHGVGRTLFKDTRLLSPGAAMLYLGTKEGKEGIEIKTLNPMDALEKLARILGSYEADNRQKKSDPLSELLERLGGPQSGLGVVDNPPEDDGL